MTGTRAPQIDARLRKLRAVLRGINDNSPPEEILRHPGLEYSRAAAQQLLAAFQDFAEK